MKMMLSLLLLAAAQAQAQQAFDVKAVLAEAKQSASEAASIEPSADGYIRRYDSDCVRFTFDADDAPVSEAVWLRSTEWVQECTWHGDPRHGGGGRQCWERPGHTYNERVQITIKDRKTLYPWEKDSFQVCLQGPWLDVAPLATAYGYRMVGGGNRNGDIVITPAEKRRMKPDASAITAQLGSNGVLKLTDKWASYYAGEKVVLKLKLVRESRGPDSTVGEKELEFSEVPAEVDVKAFAKLEAGKRYYAKIEFKRVGAISKPDWANAGQTPAVPYQPNLLAKLD